MIISLIGYKTCGKTTLGNLLAQQHDFSLFDSDVALLKAQPSQSIGTLYQQLGEQKFRELESQIILAHKPSPPSVIATGGGSLLAAGVGEYLHTHSCVIYLHTPAEILWQRIQAHPDWPVYLEKGLSATQFVEQVARREGLYQQVAHHSVLTQSQTEQQLIQTILQLGEDFYGQQ